MDQYIISYKLNLTWINPEGVCDRLRTVDECTVNPTDQYQGVQRRGWREAGAAPHRGVCSMEGGVESWVQRGDGEQWIWSGGGDGVRGRDGGSIVHHLLSGSRSLLPVIICKRLLPLSVSIMVGLFRHSQFYGLIQVLQKSICVNACLCLCVHREIILWIRRASKL